MEQVPAHAGGDIVVWIDAVLDDDCMHNERELAALVATHNPEGVRWFDTWFGAPSLAAF